ncbi:hypothetical protein JW711_00445 [Candidatus Woesearchaeota archaeon]|nr:hypothetical protein [Candidatus Woesearchaeota archaeon]
MTIKKTGASPDNRKAKDAPAKMRKFEQDIKNLSQQELHELLMINMYKQALLRAQLEAVTNILIKSKLATYEEIWKETNENFKNTV